MLDECELDSSMSRAEFFQNNRGPFPGSQLCSSLSSPPPFLRSRPSCCLCGFAAAQQSIMSAETKMKRSRSSGEERRRQRLVGPARTADKSREKQNSSDVKLQRGGAAFDDKPLVIMYYRGLVSTRIDRLSCQVGLCHGTL